MYILWNNMLQSIWKDFDICSNLLIMDKKTIFIIYIYIYIYDSKPLLFII